MERTVAHRGKTQLNFFSQTQQSFREHNNLSRTKQFFREHNKIFHNTKIFFRTQRKFLIHNNPFQNTIKFSDTQTQIKTQQNFKVLVTNPDAKSDRNLELALVTWALRSCSPCSILLPAMFYHCCGAWRGANHKFCPKCGITLCSSSASQVSYFKKFVSQKSKERQTTFNSKSKKAKMDEFVTITIGIGSPSCGVFKPVKGKSLPLKVRKHSSAQAILDEALKKRSSYDRTFRNDKTCKLCFPDGSEVSTLPGTNGPSTLEKCKEDLGKTYTRITLFLCPLEDASDTEPERTSTSEVESLIISDKWLNDLDLGNDDRDIFPAYVAASSGSFTSGVQSSSSGMCALVLN